MDPILLETDRLTLRSYVPEDIDDLYQLLSDPEVMRYYPSPLTREEAEKWLVQIFQDYEDHGHGFIAAHLRDTEEYIGQVGIMRRDREGPVHYYLAYQLLPRFWGKGYASEMVRKMLDYGFDTLSIPRVEALIDVENARSIRLAQKMGLQFESTTQHMGKEHHVCWITR